MSFLDCFLNTALALGMLFLVAAVIGRTPTTTHKEDESC